MSSINSMGLLARPDEASSERLNLSTSSPLEPKQTMDNLLLESKRLIKSGYYKKAFNLVEAFKGEEPYIPPVVNIKLCRRMVICLTRICTRYLMKGDLHRVDHFLKLMNKSFDYLQNWHDLLCSYISKTNPKFNHLRKILTEPSELYEETLETGEMARIKLKSPSMNHHHNTSILSTAESRETKNSNFLNRIRQNMTASKDPVYSEDVSHFDPDSRLIQESLTGQEVNASFHLDEFIKYYLITLLNWANFFKKATKKFDSAYRFLLFAHKIAKVLDSCLDPEILQLVSKIRIALGVLYSEFGRQKDALDIFESTLNLLQVEMSLRINRSQEKKKSIVQIGKLQETIRHLILVSMNMAIIYEQRDNYSRTLESLRLGVWFAGKFLSSDDELLNTINTQYNIAFQRYDKYLKELGELERVVAEKTNENQAEDNKEDKSSNHVAKMNYYLYNKFNYERLNNTQYIVLTSPSGYDKENNVKNNKSEFLSEDRTEFGESKNWSRLRDLRTEGSSFVRTGTGTMDDVEMQYTSNSIVWKRQGTASNKHNPRENKKKYKLDTPDESHFMTSRKYHTEGAFETEKDEFQLDSEDEKEYIEKLNRNIKEKKKATLKKKGPNNTMDYLDVDSFFDKVVDKRIKEKEEELKLHQPKEFKNIVKDYGYFLKSEKFDDIEFGFATRTLTAKARENLGDYEGLSKYKPPSFKVAERNAVKIEAQHIEARIETENKVNRRNLDIKSLMQSQAKSPLSKSVKFANSPSGRETRMATLITIEEQQPSTTRSIKQSSSMKATFSGLLRKHHEDLGLTSTHNFVRSAEKKSSKIIMQKKQKHEMTKLGLINPSPNNHSHGSPMSRFQTPRGALSARSKNRNRENREMNPEQVHKFAETTKNTIQLWMETIEKSIENDDDIQKRIEENKPLVQLQKPQDKFLKVPEDLAKSTRNLSIKAQGAKKVFNFSQLVKTNQLLNAKKTVTIKAP